MIAAYKLKATMPRLLPLPGKLLVDMACMFLRRRPKHGPYCDCNGHSRHQVRCDLFTHEWQDDACPSQQGLTGTNGNKLG
jgi:hypothetical protein